MNKLLIVSFAVLLLASCKKEEPYDESLQVSQSSTPATLNVDSAIIGNYYPAWPGSWWGYVDSSGLTFTNTCDAQWYSLHYDSFDSTRVFVCPRINGGRYISKYSFFSQMYISDPRSWSTFLKEELAVGYGFSEFSFPGNQGVSSNYIYAKDTSIILPNGLRFDSVIVVMNQRFSNNPLYINDFKKTYYAKHVGLVWDQRSNYYADSTFVDLYWLTGYFINR